MNLEFKELQERMSTYGLTRRRWRSRTTSVLDGQSFGPQLKGFAEQSGPLFVAFLQDLSTRLDLLPLSDCMTLAATEDHSAETPVALLESLIEESLGSPIEDLFAVFEPQALRRSVFTQWHTAVTIDGEEVMVELIRPDTTHEIDAQFDRLRVLTSLHVPDEDWLRLDVPRLIDEFRSDLETRLDLRVENDALKSLHSAVVDTDALTVAEPVDDLCSRHVLTVKRIEGRYVDEAVVEDSTEENSERDDERDDDVSRQLCLAWMQQALLGECYPAQARAENLLVCDHGRFAVLGGGIARLAPRTRAVVLDYMAAASRQDPDLAAMLLTREMNMNADASLESLRLTFRQAEPFRDGGWIPDYAGQRLAHNLFVHWRLANRSGFEQLPPLRRFCRGLAELENTTRQMAPSRDALQQGLDDLRVIGAAVNIRQLLGPSHLLGNLERMLPAGQELLHRLNEFSLVIDRDRFHWGERHRAETSGGGHDLQIALLMIMTAVALVTPLIASNTAWLEPLGVSAFLAIAGTLFWQIGKRGEQ